MVDLVLRDNAYSDIFTALACDLLTALATADETISARQVVLDRLEDWRRLLASVRPDGLPPERQRGLFGELTVLERLLLPVAGRSAIAAWTGPERGLQDFQFPAVAIEVKTIAGHNAEAVRIANERQLDHGNAGSLFLVTLALDVRRGGVGQSLPDLVGSLRGSRYLKGAAVEFEQCLARAGYLEIQSHLYVDQRYAVRQTLIHEVCEHFPRLTERDLPPGVSDVSYLLDLNAATAWRATEHEMTSRLELKA